MGTVTPIAAAPGAGEVMRVTSPGGGVKEIKQAQMHHLYMPHLLDIGKVGAMGAAKYDTYNYRKGIPMSQLFDAAMRHLLTWWEREDADPESGLSHLSHAAWNVMALATQAKLAGDGLPGLDDRPTTRGTILAHGAVTTNRIQEAELVFRG